MTPHPNSRGGVFFDKYHGRWKVTCRDGSQVFYARAVMMADLGRSLQRHEHVHHINGDCTDDRLENLQVLPHKEHIRLHCALNGRWALDYEACRECGTTEARHEARGLCNRCWQRERYRRLSAETKARYWGVGIQ